MVKKRQLHILLVDDEPIIHATIGDYLRDSGHRVDSAENGEEGLAMVSRNSFDLALVDLRMPKMDGIALLRKIAEIRPLMPVVMITGHGKMETVVEALRAGAADFLTKPVKFLELDAVLEKSLRIRNLKYQQHHLQQTIRGLQASEELANGSGAFVGKSDATAAIRMQIKRAVEAQCDTILITGETGTGKEVAAREVHRLGSPQQGPFIAVSCPALPDTLVESELFGHVKGSFTGAAEDRTGYFQMADGGTLFLDEIADLSSSAQATLLRVLETRTLRPVGGSEEVTVNVRVVAATNTALEKLIEAGKFRRDLYYRLNVFSIALLPLRERPDDILPLARHFLSVYATNRNLKFQGFSKEAESMLRRYDYPGNARELRNIIERAAILCQSEEIDAADLNLSAGTATPSPAPGPAQEDDERSRILAALEETRWNRREAAKRLGMAYSTLRYKIKSLNID